ncbi:MAG: hypothetical protein M1824_006071 [Vezdaea acicularis]|nr:MAG: hypothetical protein M1824_006071 [Vezdaea acicularis]
MKLSSPQSPFSSTTRLLTSTTLFLLALLPPPVHPSKDQHPLTSHNPLPAPPLSPISCLTPTGTDLTSTCLSLFCACPLYSVKCPSLRSLRKQVLRRITTTTSTLPDLPAELWSDIFGRTYGGLEDHNKLRKECQASCTCLEVLDEDAWEGVRKGDEIVGMLKGWARRRAEAEAEQTGSQGSSGSSGDSAGSGRRRSRAGASGAAQFVLQDGKGLNDRYRYGSGRSRTGGTCKNVRGSGECASTFLDFSGVSSGG